MQISVYDRGNKLSLISLSCYQSINTVTPSQQFILFSDRLFTHLVSEAHVGVLSQHFSIPCSGGKYHRSIEAIKECIRCVAPLKRSFHDLFDSHVINAGLNDTHPSSKSQRLTSGSQPMACQLLRNFCSK